MTTQRVSVDTKRIVVDAMGGDNAPGEVVAGTITAVREHGVRAILVGEASRHDEIQVTRHTCGGYRYAQRTRRR